MRNLKELTKKNGRIYVTAESEHARKTLLTDLKREDFAFADGTLPDLQTMERIYALHDDLTVRHLGWAGHVVYHYAKTGREEDGRRFCQIDYDNPV